VSIASIYFACTLFWFFFYLAVGLFCAGARRVSPARRGYDAPICTGESIIRQERVAWTAVRGFFKQIALMYIVQVESQHAWGMQASSGSDTAGGIRGIPVALDQAVMGIVAAYWAGFLAVYSVLFRFVVL
jgi:hypothetical protein